MPLFGSEPRPIRVQFQDGHLSCTGTLDTGLDSVPDGVDEDGVWETTGEVAVRVVDDGELVTAEATTPLVPGLYVINSNGLFLKIDGSAAA